MYLYNLACNNFYEMIKKNKILIIGVYEKNCIISDLFKGVMFKTNSLSNKKVTVALIEKEEYLKIIRDDEKQIFPIVLKFLNGINVMKIYGFNNYFTLIKKLKLVNLNV